MPKSPEENPPKEPAKKETHKKMWHLSIYEYPFIVFNSGKHLHMGANIFSCSGL
jgi:hypothetical protein